MSVQTDRRKTVDLQNSLVMIPWRRKSCVIKTLMSKSCCCYIPKVFNRRRWQHIGMALSETRNKRIAEWRNRKLFLFNKHFLLNLCGKMDPSACALPKFILHINGDLASSSFFFFSSSSFLYMESSNPPLCSTLGTSVANLVLSLFEANSCPVAIQRNSLGEVILKFLSNIVPLITLKL